MATNGVNGQQQQFDIYNVNFQKDIKPKDEQTARSLFNALWDEAGNMLDEADANGDGTVDANDIPKLQQLVKMLQDAQGNITKNFKKFTHLDVGTFKNGFEVCENNLQKVINEITDGSYVSQKEKTAKAQAEAKAKAEAYAKAKASLEPQDTDSEEVQEARQRRNFMREVARGYGWEPRENSYGGWDKLEPSDINGMYYTMLKDPKTNHREKVEVFAAWLDLHRGDISKQDMKNWGEPKLKALMKSAEMHEFYDSAINDYINNENYGSSYIARHGDEYQKVMQKYGHSHDLNADMEVVNPEYNRQGKKA